MNKSKVVENWIKNHGACSIDLKNKDIILHDGGLFSIDVKSKIKPKTKLIINKKADKNGCYSCKFIPIKKNGKIIKEKVNYYNAIFWFEELNETINYLKGMEKMLNKLGYKTKITKK